MANSCIFYITIICCIYASVYCGILNIPTNKASRSILIDPLKKSLFFRDHQSIRKIKIEIFQTIEQHKMIHASTRHFSKIRFVARLVGQHDNIKTKGKKPMSNLQWPLFYPKTPLHNCVRRKESSR